MLVAALILGSAAFGELGLVLPLVIPAIGVITAVIGIFAVSPRPTDRSGMSSINRGFFISAAISAILVVVRRVRVGGRVVGAVSMATSPARPLMQELESAHNYSSSALSSSASSLRRSSSSSPPTSLRPTVVPWTTFAKTSMTGPATVILSGVSLGLESAVYTALVIGAAVYGAFPARVGHHRPQPLRDRSRGNRPVDHRGASSCRWTPSVRCRTTRRGIAEMSGDVEGEGRCRIDPPLTRSANSTKGHHQGNRDRHRGSRCGPLCSVPSGRQSSVPPRAHPLRSTAPIGDIGDSLQYLGVLDVASPSNLIGLIIGAAVVFLFSGLAINAVSRAAGAVIFEVRRQFREIPGIMEGTTKPEYGKVVDIVTRDSLRELVTPGLTGRSHSNRPSVSVWAWGALGRLPRGHDCHGASLMAVFLSNSGGAWDNAKKFVEDGNFGGKNSEAHSATVIGDTVGRSVQGHRGSGRSTRSSRS